MKDEQQVGGERIEQTKGIKRKYEKKTEAKSKCKKKNTIININKNVENIYNKRE